MPIANGNRKKPLPSARDTGMAMLNVICRKGTASREQSERRVERSSRWRLCPYERVRKRKTGSEWNRAGEIRRRYRQNTGQCHSNVLSCGFLIREKIARKKIVRNSWRDGWSVLKPISGLRSWLCFQPLSCDLVEVDTKRQVSQTKIRLGKHIQTEKNSEYEIASTDRRNKGKDIRRVR